MIFKAIDFAVNAHRGQYRKGTKIPYIVHPLNMARLLIRKECPEEVVTAGILHDTVEDTPVTLSDIREAFGVKVAGLVASVSTDKNKSWEERKKDTVETIKRASDEVLFIESADKLDNIITIREDYEQCGDEVWNRFKRGREHQCHYYKSLLEAFSMRKGNLHYASIIEEFRKEVHRVFGAD